MKGKKALILASALLFLSPAVIGGREPSTPQPIDTELFHSVILPKEEKAIPIIIEPHSLVIPTGRPEVKIIQKPVIIDLTTPKPVIHVGNSHVVAGKVSWYCNQYDGGFDGPVSQKSICRVGYLDGSGRHDFYAAAGPALRTAIGGIESSRAYSGKIVRVCNDNNGKCVNVKLVDWCQCYYKQSHEKVIDLYKDAWDAISSGGMGRVTITW